MNLEDQYGVALVGLPDAVICIYPLASKLLKVSPHCRYYRLLFRGERRVIVTPETVPQICWSTCWGRGAPTERYHDDKYYQASGHTAQRPKLSDPARGTRGLQPDCEGRVRCCALGPVVCMRHLRNDTLNDG
jgi:hypothetical protein